VHAGGAHNPEVVDLAALRPRIAGFVVGLDAIFSPACSAAIMVASATSGGGIWALRRVIHVENAMKDDSPVVQHQVGTREEWLAARLKLLKEEKEHTRRGDGVLSHLQRRF